MSDPGRGSAVDVADPDPIATRSAPPWVTRLRTALRPSGWDRDVWLAVVFATGAVAVRVAFWAYTGRIWEDALITLAPARNAWLGNGLTHHLSEPAVHSFTSPLSVLVPLVGEAFREGLLATRLVSLVAAFGTILVAHRIAAHLGLGLAPRLFLFTYLAADQLQIFFGMAGMETQIATLVLLANVLLLLQRRWTPLGVLCGLSLLARPEFALWVVVAGVAVLVNERRAVVRWGAAAAAVVVPWVAFTTAYYGSPVPHTIVAKSFYDGGLTRVPTADQVTTYLGGWWTAVAPFRSWFFTLQTPVPRFFLQLAALAFVSLAVAGVWRARRTCPALLAVAAFLAAFFAYRTWAILSTYFMWYLPPVVALAAVLAAVGLEQLRRSSPRPAAALGIGLAVLYALHIPFSFPIERRVQRDVEWGVRYRIGQELAARMTADDTVVLEPLGYIGYAAFNRTTYDFPGLSSPTVTDALAELPPPERNIAGMINRLRPTFLVLRDPELALLRAGYPGTAAEYRLIEVVEARPDLDLSQWGLSYFTGDHRFSLLERQSPR